MQPVAGDAGLYEVHARMMEKEEQRRQALHGPLHPSPEHERVLPSYKKQGVPIELGCAKTYAQQTRC
jgi:hypothetical protein